MKKLILCLVFVVAAGAIINANSNNNGIYIDCYVDCNDYSNVTQQTIKDKLEKLPPTQDKDITEKPLKSSLVDSELTEGLKNSRRL